MACVMKISCTYVMYVMYVCMFMYLCMYVCMICMYVCIHPYRDCGYRAGSASVGGFAPFDVPSKSIHSNLPTYLPT